MNRAFIAVGVVVAAVALVASLRARDSSFGGPARPTLAATPRASAGARDHSVASSPTPRAASAEDERLEARRILYETVDAFLQNGELEKARQLLDQDQERHADGGESDWRDLEQSYRLIADCLEQPTAQKRARARAFAVVSQAVALKPRILEACRD